MVTFKIYKERKKKIKKDRKKNALVGDLIGKNE